VRQLVHPTHAERPERVPVGEPIGVAPDRGEDLRIGHILPDDFGGHVGLVVGDLDQPTVRADVAAAVVEEDNIAIFDDFGGVLAVEEVFVCHVEVAVEPEPPYDVSGVAVDFEERVLRARGDDDRILTRNRFDCIEMAPVGLDCIGQPMLTDVPVPDFLLGLAVVLDDRTGADALGTVSDLVGEVAQDIELFVHEAAVVMHVEIGTPPRRALPVDDRRQDLCSRSAEEHARTVREHPHFVVAARKRRRESVVPAVAPVDVDDGGGERDVVEVVVQVDEGPAGLDIRRVARHDSW